MKKQLLIALVVLNLTGCATIQHVAQTSEAAVSEVQNEHTPEEWATFWSVLFTVSNKGAEIAYTKTGRDTFKHLAETSSARAEHWRNKNAE